MAVSNGQKILQSDMDALATLANSKTNLSFGFGNSFPSGVKFISGFRIDPSNLGSGYKPGDYLQGVTDGTISDLMIGAYVEKVGASGELLAIRVDKIYNFSPSASLPSSPASFTSIFGGSHTSGTGAKLLFSITTETTRNYSFDDWDYTAGSITDFYLVAGGTGYSISDVLTVEGGTITVNTVDGFGVILTWTKTTDSTATTISSDVSLVSATGGTGTGAKFGCIYFYSIKPYWLTELNRLRNDLNSYNPATASTPEISGKWPVSGFTSTLSGKYSSVDFYFASTLSQSVSYSVSTYDFYCDEYVSDILAGSSGPFNYSSMTIRIKIGGNSSVSVSGVLRCLCNYSGTAPTLTVSGDFPSISYTILDSAGTRAWDFTWSSVSVAPGDYYITVSLSGSNVFSTPRMYASTSPMVVSLTSSSATSVAGIHNSIDVRKISCEAPNTTSGFEMGVWAKDVATGAAYPSVISSSMLHFIGKYGTSYYVNWRTGLPSYSATISGFWTAKTIMISDINAVRPFAMPWNLARHFHSSPYTAYNPMLLGNDKAGASAVVNSYDNSKPVEAQSEPPSWKASIWFSVGFTIIDSNGNLQIVSIAGTSGAVHPTWAQNLGGTTTESPDTLVWTCSKVFKAQDTWTTLANYLIGQSIIDSNGNSQTAITNGISGAVEPTWGKSLNGTTSDGSVSWQLTSVAKTITSAVHKPYDSASLSLPRYPIYWYSETIARLKPPTTSSATERTIWGAGNQWQRDTYHSPSFDSGWQQDNLAKGWWIYSVSLNRISGNQYKGINLPPTSQVSVTIGCTRSGSFVAFGTYDTGQTIQVLWPIFTSDALVYQCSERIDIQVVTIGYGAAGVSFGATAASFPSCAAFVNDAKALLGLIT